MAESDQFDVEKHFELVEPEDGDKTAEGGDVKVLVGDVARDIGKARSFDLARAVTHVVISKEGVIMERPILGFGPEVAWWRWKLTIDGANFIVDIVFLQIDNGKKLDNLRFGVSGDGEFLDDVGRRVPLQCLELIFESFRPSGTARRPRRR